MSADGWIVFIAMLTDPNAGRVFVDLLRRLPAVVRLHRPWQQPVRDED